MKLTSSFKIVFIFVIAIFISSCSNSDDELKKSIYINDSDNPELPKYSERGYNTFGAYYDRQVFRSTDYNIPVKVINKDGATTFVFAGRLSGNYSQFSLSLTIADFNPTDYKALKDLDHTILDLTDNTKYSISLNENGVANPVQVISGEFNFVRVRNLLVDQQNAEVVLSGIFDFQILISDVPVTVSKGRFDVGVDKDNFFKY